MRRTSRPLTEADRLLHARIVGLYRLFHHRLVDPGGLAGSLRRLRRGEPLTTIIEEAMRSAEFRGRHPAPVCAAGDIDDLFVEAFGCPPPRLDDGDRHGCVAAYAAGLLAAQHQRAPIPVLGARYPDGVDPDDEVGYRLWLDESRVADSEAIAAMRDTASRWPDRLPLSLVLLSGGARWAGVAGAVASVRAQGPRRRQAPNQAHSFARESVQTLPQRRLRDCRRSAPPSRAGGPRRSP